MKIIQALVLITLTAFYSCNKSSSAKNTSPTPPGVYTLPETIGALSTPMYLAFDASGNLYLSDRATFTIYKISPAGTLTKFAGDGNSGYIDGQGTSAEFGFPQGIATDQAGNVYVADGSNQLIRKITPSGMVSTFAGVQGVQGSQNGAALSATLNGPLNVVVDASGNLYLADGNGINVGYGSDGASRIRKIANGMVTTLIDSMTLGAAVAGMAIDPSGNLYLSNPASSSSNILKVSPSGTVSSFGPGVPSWGIALDASGNVYEADYLTNVIVKVTPNGTSAPLAGVPTSYEAGGSNDGSLSTAQFNFPIGLTVGDSSHIFVADFGNGLIRKIVQ